LFLKKKRKKEWSKDQTQFTKKVLEKHKKIMFHGRHVDCPKGELDAEKAMG